MQPSSIPHAPTSSLCSQNDDSHPQVTQLSSPYSVPPESNNPTRIITHSHNNIFKPKNMDDFYTYHATTSQTLDTFEPRSFLEAKNIPQWSKAMSEEFDALLRNST